MILANNQKSLKRKQLHEVEVAQRDNVKNWEGINHGVLADAVIKGAKSKGLEVASEHWYINDKQTILWGSVDLVPNDILPSLGIGQDAKFSLGVRHGNGGEYAVSFAVGARIGVCSNGMFKGDFVLKKRHTPNLNLEEVIDMSLVKYISECEALEGLINGWRDTRIDSKDASYVLFRSAQENCISFRYLEDVYNNWEKPPHSEFEPRNAWSLYNAFTETAKDLTPARQLKMLVGVRKIFDAEFGIGEAYLGPEQFDLGI